MKAADVIAKLTVVVAVVVVAVVDVIIVIVVVKFFQQRNRCIITAFITLEWGFVGLSFARSSAMMAQ